MKSGLDFMKKMMKYHGLWGSSRPRGKLSWLSYLYSRLGLTAIVYRLFVVHLMDVYMSRGNVLHMCESAIISSLCIMAITKTGTLLFQTKKTKRLFRNLELIEQRNDMDDDVVKNMRDKSRRFSDRVMKYHVIILTLLGVFSAVSQLPESWANRTLQDRAWYPYDIKPSPTYEITLVFYSITIVWITNILGVCDATLVLFLVHVVRQFKVLHYNLKNLRKRAIYKLNKESQDKLKSEHINTENINLKPMTKDNKISLRIMNMEPWTEIRRTKMSKLVTRTSNALPRAALKTTKKVTKSRGKITYKRVIVTQCDVSCIKVALTNKEIDSEMLRLLGRCVEEQTALTRLTAEFEKIFNPTFKVQFAANLVITGVLAVYLSLNPDKMSNKCQAFSQLLIACLGELFVYCWMANQVTHQSSELGYAIYDCDWINASNTFKKHMGVVTSRANAPLIISTLGFIPLSMETFLRVNNTAYNNYIAMLVVMRKHHLE